MDLVKVGDIDYALKRAAKAVKFLRSQKKVRTEAYMMMADVDNRNMLQC
jgi:hypothetical protein